MSIPQSTPVHPSSNVKRWSLRGAVLATALVTSAVAFTPALHADTHVNDPKTAIRAVQNTLPSVAILGQKPGPAGTTEVFIQVPGVLNMQSVYVLGDGKTVISGVVVPPIEHGFPGAQLSLPDGNASMDPRAPRAGVDRLNEVLGVAPERQSAATSAGADKTTFSVPEVPASQSGGESGVRSSASAGGGVQTDSSSSATPGVVAEAGGSGTVPSPSSQDSAGGAGESGEILIESLDDVAQSGAFSKLVGYMLENDGDIEAIRALQGLPKQQGAYLELVQSLPAIVQGDADKRVYALFDPNCPVCHRYYAEVAPKVASGEIEVHWIPAIVFPDDRSSLTASAALLAEVQRDEGDPAAMLEHVMTQPGFAQKVDAAPNVDRLVPYLDGIVKNTAVMAMARAETPLLVFENIEGTLSISPGIPRPGYEAMIKRES